jgi:hypothetical protein
MKAHRRPSIAKSPVSRAKHRAHRQQPRKISAHDTALLAIYDGQVCLGFLLPRGREGVAVYDADDRLLGIFPDQKSAANAVSKAAAK